MFGVVPKSIWQKLNVPDEDNLCNWAMRLLLIETGRRKILVDTGIGDKQDAKFFGHYRLSGLRNLQQCMEAVGLKPDDITDVILTHLHFDHGGGAVTKTSEGTLQPTFKNATYWSNEAHWQWATQPNAREKASFLKENIMPLKESGQLRFVKWQNDETIVGFDDIDAIKLRFVHGHTRAMMLPQLSVQGRTIVYMADLIPSVGHIPLPYVMAYDMFPLITLHEKQTLLEEAVQNNYILFFEHDPQNECCTLMQTERGVRADATGTLADIFGLR